MKLHTWSWLSWLIAGLIIVSTTRNPLYLLLLILVLFIIQSILAKKESHLPISTIKFSISVLFLSSVLNAFISRFGETILFKIPGHIPLISGSVTLEAILFGAINGLVLIAMFTLFTIINAVIPVQDMVRLIPHALHPIAVVTTIALTFIPAMQQQFRTIQDAQAMRGQRLHKLSDWLPLFIPLLIGSLERAMQIAEAMTARGYSVQPIKKQFPMQKFILPALLLFIISGWLVILILNKSVLGWLLIGSGIALLFSLFFTSGRRFPKTRFHEETWKIPSIFFLFTCLGITIFFLIPFPGKETLAYNPYPLITTPTISISVLLAILLLLIPTLLNKRETHDSD